MITGLLTHGIGGREDLPIPFGYALAGAAFAVLVSFLAVGVVWRQSRLRGSAAGRQLPGWLADLLDSAWLAWALRAAGLVLAGFTALALLFGKDLANNPAPGLIYVVFWVGLVPASLLLGPVWRRMNPLRTLHLLACLALRRSPERGLFALPGWLGYWPAAFGLLAFTWLELAAPDRATLPVLRTWLAGYLLLQLVGCLLFGSRWFDRADAFEAYSSLVARLAPVGRRGDGRLVLRNPFDGLDSLRPAPGLTATVCVLLGSTAFDGLSGSIAWTNFAQDSGYPRALVATLGLLATVTLVSAVYTLATWACRPFSTVPAGELPVAFAHSLVPIAVGYVVAHYFSMLLFEGQHTVILASDPLVTGANWFSTAELGVDYQLVSPTTIANVQVLGVVVGHVLGVFAAHDRAVRILRRSMVAQLPLLVAMVGFTVGGLTLLFAG